MFVSQKVENYLSIRNLFKKKFHSLPLKAITKKVELSFWELQQQKTEKRAQEWKNFQELLSWPPGDF